MTTTIFIVAMSILGGLIGFFVPTIPYAYTKYLAVAIMAAFDSVIGATTGILQNKFDIKIFVSGFFVNSILAIILTMFGESLDVDIFLAAIFVFVNRIFTNLSHIRRILIANHELKAQESKK